MVACFIPKYRDEIPQIGKVLEENDSEVTIEWWVGTYRGKWRALTRKNGRSTERWTEVIPRSCVLYAVSLSKAAKLSDMDREKLSKTYEALLAEITDTDSDE